MELKNLYRGRIREYAEKYGCKYVEGAKPWGEKCDIALPSATQNELNGDHARQLVANGCHSCHLKEQTCLLLRKLSKYSKTLKSCTLRVKQLMRVVYQYQDLEMTQNSIKLSWSR